MRRRPELLALIPGVRLDVDSQFGVSASPRLALRCEPVSTLALRGSVGRGFRAPSFTELLLDFQNPSANYRVSGNLDLRPEHSIGASLGAEYEPSSAVRASLQLFRNDLWNLIDTRLERVEAGEQIFQYANVARARTQGVETSLVYQPDMRLVLELTHTVTETRDLHRARPLSGRALQRGSARVVLRDAARRFTLTARCVVVGRRKFFVDEGDGTTVLQLPALPQLDARAAYRFARWVEAFLSAENLTNRGGTLMPLRPTTLYAGLDLSF